MADSIVRDFLIDCQTVTEAEVHSFASSIRENNELIDSLIQVIEEKKYHKEFLEPLCEQLFAFFRAQEDPLRQFAMFFIPCIVGIYLGSVHKGDRKSLRYVELLVLGAYNLQVLDSEGKPNVLTSTIPSISKPSIYHEPIAMPQAQLTENALSKLEHGENKIVQGPYFTIESINASNRLHVALVLLRVYNQNISVMPQGSRASLCKMCSKLVNQGSAHGNRRMVLDGPLPSSFMPKVSLTSQFLLELLQAIYFSMYNGLPSLGHQALNDIHRRAMQTMYTDVLLVTNAIKNSLQVHPSGHPADGPMGISIAMSPTTSTTTLSKAIITNASFRTKKLPDDIPIPKESESPGHEGLDAIREEGAHPEEHSHTTSNPTMPQGAAQAMKAMLPSMRIIPGVTKVVKAITKREAVAVPQVEVPIPPEPESVEMGLAVVNPFVDLQTTKRDRTEPGATTETEMKKSEGGSTSPTGESVTASKEATLSKKSSAPDGKHRSLISTPSKESMPPDKNDSSALSSKRGSGTASKLSPKGELTATSPAKDTGASPTEKKTPTPSGAASPEQREPGTNVSSRKLSHTGSVAPSLPDSPEKKSEHSPAESKAPDKKESEASPKNASNSESSEKQSGPRIDHDRNGSKGEGKNMMPNGVEQQQRESYGSSVTKQSSVNSQMLQNLATAENYTSGPEELPQEEKAHK
ncbi:hyccin-like isoform X2 [Ornithodoros turicata]|uniref:hyccin-like isoform X2 n=1 Tax=Ornithodoros turicata TaxID=34597 RepID=UPI00313979E1